jgi:hypothetical protein
MFARYVLGAAFTAATIGAACAEAEPEYYVIQALCDPRHQV